LAAHVVQINHAEIPLKLTNKRNVTEVGGGGSVWANNGRKVYPAAPFTQLLPGRKNTVLWLNRSAARVTETVVRDKKLMNTIFLAYLTHQGEKIFQTKSEYLLCEYPGPIEVTARRGRRRKQLLDDLRRERYYWKVKEEALDGTLRRTRFGRHIIE
jgi:hypothetical protein